MVRKLSKVPDPIGIIILKSTFPGGVWSQTSFQTQHRSTKTKKKKKSENECNPWHFWNVPWNPGERLPASVGNTELDGLLAQCNMKMLPRFLVHQSFLQNNEDRNLDLFRSTAYSRIRPALPGVPLPVRVGTTGLDRHSDLTWQLPTFVIPGGQCSRPAAPP